MKRPTVRTLWFKLALVFGPFILFFISVLVRVPYATYQQQFLAEDKIQKLVLDASSTPQVIVDGDSRAQDNFIPAIFTKETGLSSVNVGAGDLMLAQAYDTLQHTGVLNHAQLIIISVSMYDINDTQGHNQFIDTTIIDNEPWGMQKIKDLITYYNSYITFYLTYTKSLMRFAHFDYQHMSPALVQTSGYLADTTDVLTPPHNGAAPFDPLGWYADLRLRGLRQQAFVKAIQGFGATNDTVVLYIGPVAPLGKMVNAGTKADPADVYFAQVITDAIAPYPNIHFINFEASDTSSILPNQAFGDYVHLNESGATVFSKLLADTLKKEGIIK